MLPGCLARVASAVLDLAAGRVASCGAAYYGIAPHRLDRMPARRLFTMTLAATALAVLGAGWLIDLHAVRRIAPRVARAGDRRQRHPAVLGVAAGVLLGGLVSWAFIAIFIVPGESPPPPRFSLRRRSSRPRSPTASRDRCTIASRARGSWHRGRSAPTATTGDRAATTCASRAPRSCYSSSKASRRSAVSRASARCRVLRHRGVELVHDRVVARVLRRGRGARRGRMAL